jgi:hypothetical protein
MEIRLFEKETMMIDGMQFILTGLYDVVGPLNGTPYSVVKCPDTQATYIVELTNFRNHESN